MWKKHLPSIWYEKNYIIYIYIYSNYKHVKWNWTGHSSLCLAKMSKFWVSLAMTAVPAAPGCSLLGFGSWNDFLLQPGTMNPWPVEGTNVFPKKMGGPEFSAKSGRSSSSMRFKAVGKIASFFSWAKRQNIQISDSSCLLPTIHILLCCTLSLSLLSITNNVVPFSWLQ